MTGGGVTNGGVTADAVLLPYQQRWVRDAAQVKLYEKSRRIGATWAEAADAVLAAARSGGIDVYYISYNLDIAREFVLTCAEWARIFQEAASAVEEEVIRDEEEDIRTYRITFPSGKRIIGLPSRATTLRGKQGRVVIDEAAFVDDVGEILKAALALLMWGGDVRILSTHNGEESDFNELIKECRQGKRPYSVHKTTIEDALDEGLYRRILERRGKGSEWSAAGQRAWLDELVATYGEAAQEELYCVPARGGSKYFPRAMVERAMDAAIPVLSYEQPAAFTYLPEEERRAATERWIAEHLEPVLAAHRAEHREAGRLPLCYVGQDVARSGDLSLISAAAETERLALRAIVYVEMRGIPFQQQKQVLDAVIDGLVRFAGAAIDARGNGQMLAELVAQERGPAYVHEVMLSRATYAEYLPRYRALLEDEGFRLPQHAGILDDHRVVVLDRGVPVIAERTGAPGQQRHGDSVVSGMLVVYARHNDDDTYQPYQYESVADPTGGDYWRGITHGEEEDWEEAAAGYYA